jgi:hypothetical protein
VTDFVFAKSDTIFIEVTANLLSVAMVIEMRFFGMRVEKIMLIISDAMNFYAVFRIDLVINLAKRFLSTSKSPSRVVSPFILVFQHFVTFFATFY